MPINHTLSLGKDTMSISLMLNSSVMFILSRSLLQPAIHEGLLAPTTVQRLKYMKWHHVYGKDRAILTECQMKELSIYNVSVIQI